MDLPTHSSSEPNTISRVTLPATTQTDRQSINSVAPSPVLPRNKGAFVRDERHPQISPVSTEQVPAQPQAIDHNTLTQIINNILTQTQNNTPVTPMPTTQPKQQYLLPVDLLVSVDAMNKPTVQAALPSAFAMPSVPLSLASLPMSTPTIPTPTPSIPLSLLTPSPFPFTPTAPLTVPQVTPQAPKPSAPLNASAESFKPTTTYTAFGQSAAMTSISETAPTEFDDITVEKQAPPSSALTQPQSNPWYQMDEQKVKEMPQMNLMTSPAFTPAWNNFNMQYQYQNPIQNQNKPWYGNKPPRYYRMENKKRAVKLLVEFVAHVTLKNREHYPANSILTKTWAMKNVGNHEWGHDTELVYCKGSEELPMLKRFPVKNAQPGETIEISATIRTPAKAGRYCTYFRLQKYGRFFGPRVWVDVIVDEKMNKSSLHFLQQRLVNQVSCAQAHSEHFKDKNPWKKHDNLHHNHYKVVSCK